MREESRMRENFTSGLTRGRGRHGSCRAPPVYSTLLLPYKHEEGIVEIERSTSESFLFPLFLND